MEIASSTRTSYLFCSLADHTERTHLKKQFDVLSVPLVNVLLPAPDDLEADALLEIDIVNDRCRDLDFVEGPVEHAGSFDE